MESAFAVRFVGNPYSGELVKGHCIAIAEMGLVPYEGKAVRDPGLFGGDWSRERRERHVLARLAFLFALFSLLARRRLVLFRGFSTEGTAEPPRNDTFVSATFCEDVARSHFEGGSERSTRALFRRPVPIRRIFMTYLETEAMNRSFREAEAVLLYEGGATPF